MSFVLAPLIRGGEITDVFLMHTLPPYCSSNALLQDQGRLPLEALSCSPSVKVREENFRAIDCQGNLKFSRLPRTSDSQNCPSHCQGAWKSLCQLAALRGQQLLAEKAPPPSGVNFLTIGKELRKSENAEQNWMEMHLGKEKCPQNQKSEVGRCCSTHYKVKSTYIMQKQLRCYTCVCCMSY